MNRLPFVRGESCHDQPSTATREDACPPSQQRSAFPSAFWPPTTPLRLNVHPQLAPAYASVPMSSVGSSDAGRAQAHPLDNKPSAPDTPRFQELPSAFTGACPVPPEQICWIDFGGQLRGRGSTHSGATRQEAFRDMSSHPTPAPRMHHSSPHFFPLPFCGSPSQSNTSASASELCKPSVSVPLLDLCVLPQGVSKQDATPRSAYPERAPHPPVKSSSANSRRRHWAFAHLPMPSKSLSRSPSPPSHAREVLPKILVPKDASARIREKASKEGSEPAGPQRSRLLRSAAAGPAIVAELQNYIRDHVTRTPCQVPGGHAVEMTFSAHATGTSASSAGHGFSIIPPTAVRKAAAADGAGANALSSQLQIPSLLRPAPLSRRLSAGEASGSHSCPVSPSRSAAQPIVVCPVHGVVCQRAPPPIRVTHDDSSAALSGSSTGRNMHVFSRGSPLLYEALVGPQVSRYFSAPGDMDVECFCGSCPDLTLPLRKSLSLNFRPKAAPAVVDANEASKSEDLVELLAPSPTWRWRDQLGDATRLVRKLPAELERAHGAPDDAKDGQHAAGFQAAIVAADGHVEHEARAQDGASVVFNALPGAGGGSGEFDKVDAGGEKAKSFEHRREEVFSEEWSNMVLTSAITSTEPSYNSHDVHSTPG